MQLIKTWIDGHLNKRTGERNQQLREGYNDVEDAFVKEIWLPTFHDLDNLHPEYEVVDVLEGRRYINFAYLKSGVKIGIIIDASSEQFSNQFVRDMQLKNLGWTIIHLSASDVAQRPILWQKLFQQFIGRLFGVCAPKIKDTLDIELLSYLFNLHRPFKIQDVQSHLKCGYRLARQIILSLANEEWISPRHPEHYRIHEWVLTDKFRFLGMPFSTSNEAKELLGDYNHRRFGRHYRSFSG